jgi:hypothetical protein
VALLLLVQGFVIDARAQVSPGDRETARGLMEEGDARYEKGEWDQALQMYRGAHELMQVPTTGIAVARVLVRMRQLVEARDMALQVARIPVEPGEHPVFGEAREEAQRLAAELEPRIPSVRVQLRGNVPVAGVTVTIDGKELPRVAALLPRKVNPGRVFITVRGEGIPTATKEVLVEEREAREVEVELGAIPDSQAGGAEPANTGTTSLSPLVYVGFGLGAAGVIAGSVTGLMAKSQTSDLKEECGGAVCPPSLHGDYDSANRLATISNVSFAVGLVGVGLGVYGLVSGVGVDGESSERSEGVQWRVMAGPGLTGVQGRF